MALHKLLECVHEKKINQIKGKIEDENCKINQEKI